MSFVDRLLQLEQRGERAVLFTALEGPDVGEKLLVFEHGESVGALSAELSALVPELLRRARNTQVEVEGGRVFAEVFGPPPRLLVYGAVDTAESLCRAAKLLGWTTIVADARAKFATGERLPSADELIVAWPAEAFEQARPDSATAVVVLTHDDKFDVPALEAALSTDAFYIGAIGSRRTQDRRRGRLLEAGVAEDALLRISGPTGLDIGADSNAETALSILAEAVATRAGRTGGPLRESKQRIHAGST